MSEKLKPIFMTIIPTASTAGTSWLVFVERATTLLGFCTALVGLGVAVCSLIWWIKRLRK